MASTPSIDNTHSFVPDGDHPQTHRHIFHLFEIENRAHHRSIAVCDDLPFMGVFVSFFFANIREKSKNCLSDITHCTHVCMLVLCCAVCISMRSYCDILRIYD